MTTLREYQTQAKATAQVEAYDHAYLIPGIVGEVGELFGQKAKATWHGWDADTLQTELVAEYGDICWMTALLLDMFELHDETDPVRNTTVLRPYTREPWQTLLGKAYSLHMFHTDPECRPYITGAARDLWVTLRAQCEAITGASFDDVLAYNGAKLAARAAKGVLRGSGDHR